MKRPAKGWRAELQWAWRNVLARRSRAALSVALLGTALAANVIVFAVTDSLVFRRVLYPDADRLVQIVSRNGRFDSTFASPALLDEWRKQSQLFQSVNGFLTKITFLSGGSEPELVNTADVTPGVFEMLGVGPRWGRTFDAEDARRADVQAVIISETLARKRFGDPGRAIGQTLETTDQPLVVVGVMPATFRFPSAAERIWRALDPRGPLARGFAGVNTAARLAPGISVEAVSGAMAARSRDIAREAGAATTYEASPAPLPLAAPAEDTPRLYVVLLAAALCLLLIACANVASLELASAIARVRAYAVRLALGASRGSLTRVALVEGACLIGAATILGAVLAYAGAAALADILPAQIGNRTANPIDLDERGFAYMVAIAAAAWLFASLPAALYLSRTSLLDLLKLEGHGAVSARGTFIRRALTVAQVALTVLLLVGSALYVRTYLALLRLDKGFDTSGVVSIDMTIPPQFVTSEIEHRALAQTVLDAVRARPGVLAAFEGAPPPSTGNSPSLINQLEIDNRSPENAEILIGEKSVDRDYFATLRIPLRSGRMFERGEPRTNVIVPEALARRLWPDGHAIGHRFRLSPSQPWYYVVGVAGHVRTAFEGTRGPSSRQFLVYVPRQPPPPIPAAPAPAGRRVVSSGMVYRMLTVTARVDTPERANDLYRAIRALDSRYILEVDFVDDIYAREFASQLLATRVVGAFGALAFALAAVGIYGLMTFLVAHRAQEIGIRLALGAAAPDIRTLVVGSSLRLVGAGIALGLGGALLGARWAQSQFFGVEPTDPVTLGGVAVIVVVTAIIATWQPARRAARIDPKVLLRN